MVVCSEGMEHRRLGVRVLERFRRRHYEGLLKGQWEASGTVSTTVRIVSAAAAAGRQQANFEE